MTAFLIGAALLVALASALVAVPLLKPRSGEGAAPAAPWAALAAIGALVFGGAALYATWSNWSWQSPPAADTAQDMVARLARRLEREPNDLEGWLMLGRSYVVLEQYPLAKRAYQRADRLAAGGSAEALIGLAEAMALEDDAALAGEAGRLFDRALELDPRSGKALFFSAVAAQRRGDLPLARERFAALLALGPPDNVRPLLEQQIAAIDQALGAAGAAVTGQPRVAGAPPAQDRAAGADAAVRVRVLAGADLPADLADAPLFVIVRDPAAPGAPLAVKRLPNRLPVEVTLTAADAMIAGRSITPGQRVEVVARISRSGQPSASPGDPYGQLRYDIGRDGLREIVVDRKAP